MDTTQKRENDKRFSELRESLEAENDFLPILHNADVLFLQFHGWSINLNRDGTYWMEVTEGG